uniref:Polyprotein 2 n=1 Tax=Physostegia virginiana crinkle-associated virus 1 TaxID=3075965 RepID=A0AA95Z384_9VIRU|nr:polyprotein 2 [Physostegia virginiana crinkle-associated virus 1]
MFLSAICYLGFILCNLIIHTLIFVCVVDFVVIPFLLNHIANFDCVSDTQTAERTLIFTGEKSCCNPRCLQFIFFQLFQGYKRRPFNCSLSRYLIVECKLDALDVFYYVPMAAQNVMLSPLHAENAMLFKERAEKHRMAQESSHSILPETTELFKRGFLNKLCGSGPVTTSEMLIGNIRGSGVQTFKIPITPLHTVERYDDRISANSRKAAPQIVVGAIEIINDGFASVNSDVTIGAAVYDSRHMELTNSFKGAFATRASGLPTHTVLYPAHRCLSTDPVNDSLTLSCISRDTDFADQFTLAQIKARTVYKEVKSTDDIRATDSLRQREYTDLVAARQFAQEGNVVVVQPRMYPKVNLDNYEVPGPKHEAATVGTYSKGFISFAKPTFSPTGVVMNYTRTVAKRDRAENIRARAQRSLSDSDDDEGELTFKQGQALMEEDVRVVDIKMTPLHDIPETMRLLQSVRANIPLNITPGHRVYTLYMHELLKIEGVHTKLLQLLGKIPGCLKLRAHCEIPPTCGIGLYATYVEGNESSNLGVDLGRLLALQHTTWNPAIEPYKEFLFKPMSCCDWWNMHYLGSAKKAPVLCVGAVSAWNQAPKQPPNITISLYFEPDIQLPKQISSTTDICTASIFKRIGTVTYKQGVIANVVFEVNFGKPQVDGDVASNNMASAISSMFQYVSSGIEIELSNYSSPMLTGTFTLCYVPSSFAVVTLQDLDSMPSATFTFNRSRTSVKIRFPKEVFPMPMASERWNISGKEDADVTGRFHLWQRDGISSATEGDMMVHIDARAYGDVDFGGISAGYPLRSARVKDGKSMARFVSGAPTRALKNRREGQAVLHSFDYENVWYTMAHWKFDDNIFGQRDTADKVKQHKLKLRLNGTKNSDDFLTQHSPVTRILQNCAWFRGELQFRLCIEMSADFPAYLRCSQIAIDVHENSLSSHCFAKHVMGSNSGVVEFSKFITGPVDGFAAMGWSIHGDKKFCKLAIYLGNVYEVEKITLQCRFGREVYHSGQQKATWFKLDKVTSVVRTIAEPN